MTAEIISFVTRQTVRPAAARPQSGRSNAIGQNERLRLARREQWRRAEALTDFLQVSLRQVDAVSIAKRHDLEAVRGMVEFTQEERWALLESYREAVGKQILTPAPDVAAVNWKRAKLKNPYYGVEQHIAEQAIAADVAWLDAHPARQRKGNGRPRKVRT